MAGMSQEYLQGTSGRGYCFVIMDFKGHYQFFKQLQVIVSETTGCECKRADELLDPAGDLRPKIHAAIEGAAFVLAELSTLSPNVFYEVGYAIARSKPTILMVRDDVPLPTDFGGVEMLRYTDTRQGELIWREDLRSYLRQNVETNRSLVHAFVLPENPDLSYIIANPKLPDASSSFKYHPVETRTYGDYLGVAGLFGAFASFYGENFAPELVSAAHASNDIKDADANLFLIGSPKVNKFTRWFLAALQADSGPGWRLDTVDGSEDTTDPPCELSGRLPGGETFSRVATEGPEDYGLIVRGPHPRFPARMVLILAGPQSLGTGSACLAATRSELIRKIRETIGNDRLFADRRRALWVLVKGVAGQDRHIQPQGVQIISAGPCTADAPDLA